VEQVDDSTVKEVAVTDATTEFFESLRQRGEEPSLRRATGTMRFDIVDHDEVEHWLVSIDRGRLSVSREDSTSDCAVRAQRTLFNGVADGSVNAMAAALRGEITVGGDLRLLVLIQRLLAGLPADRALPTSADGNAS
jgi:putative sterol carrier protein